MFHCSRKRPAGNSWHLPLGSSHQNMIVAKIPAAMMWSSQLPCEGCGWAGCHPQQQGPGVEKAAAAVSSVQTCCLFFPVGFVPLVGKVVKCVSFLHWLTKSVALVWKWQEKKCAGWTHIQSSVKRFNPQGWIWVQFAWKSFASRGGDVQVLCERSSTAGYQGDARSETHPSPPRLPRNYH